MTVESIGLDNEQRTDCQLRTVFVEAFELVAPSLDESGNWLSMAHEIMAMEAIEQRFPEITGTRLMATLVTIAGVRASGRTPVQS
ncbi:MAG: hypothetical protein Q8M20_02115 [Rhodocyclaceae bacterium]|nr:hypothetical protein [Rhodocyclaceae bacterium]MDZ4213176.1 hypothetical protein [Rhodocyclaceae bacterium]